MFISLECNILQRHEVSSPGQPTTRSLAQGPPVKKGIRGDRPHRLICLQAWPGRAWPGGRAISSPKGGQVLVVRKRHSILSPGLGAGKCPACHHREYSNSGDPWLNCTPVSTQRPHRLQMLNYGEQGLALGSVTSRAHRPQQKPPAHSPLGRETRQQCRLLNIIQDLLVCPSHCAPGGWLVKWA